MSRFRKIDPRIWNDAKFCSMSDRGKLVFMMLLTHPNMTSFGAMRCTMGGLADELEWEPEAFREAFQEASRLGMAEADPKAPLIAIPNFIRYNTPESPNVIKAWVGAFDLLPECKLKTLTMQRAEAFAEGMSKGFREAFAEAFGKACRNKEKGERSRRKENAPNPSQEGDLREGTSFGSAGSRRLAVVNGGMADEGDDL